MADNAYSPGLDRLSARKQYQQQVLFIERLLAQVHTAKLVKVLSATNEGTDSPIGKVNVQPLVSMIDGLGQITEHGTLYSLPYFRLQGGSSAVIMDPVAGDLGLAVFADHDTSSVIRTGSVGAPGSRRTHDMADGFYIGCFLGTTPTQFLQFNGDGITLQDVSGSVISMIGGGITLAPKNGIVTIRGQITGTGNAGVGMVITGNVSATGDVVAGVGGTNIGLLNLRVSNVQAGSGESGIPVPGT